MALNVKPIGDRILVELVKRHEAKVVYARFQLTQPTYVLIYDRRVIFKDGRIEGHLILLQGHADNRPLHTLA